MVLIPKSIREMPGVEEYLIKRGLLKQYLEAKYKILSGMVGGTKFKQRKPYSLGVWYFRINKQYRAFGYFEKGVFIVTTIDNHQDE